VVNRLRNGWGCVVHRRACVMRCNASSRRSQGAQLKIESMWSLERRRIHMACRLSVREAWQGWQISMLGGSASTGNATSSASHGYAADTSLRNSKRSAKSGFS